MIEVCGPEITVGAIGGIAFAAELEDGAYGVTDILSAFDHVATTLSEHDVALGDALQTLHDAPIAVEGVLCYLVDLDMAIHVACEHVLT